MRCLSIKCQTDRSAPIASFAFRGRPPILQVVGASNPDPCSSVSSAPSTVPSVLSRMRRGTRDRLVRTLAPAFAGAVSECGLPLPVHPSSALTARVGLEFCLDMVPTTSSQGFHPRSTKAFSRWMLPILGLVIPPVLHAQTGFSSNTTNRFDIDVDGEADFEFITRTANQILNPGGIRAFTIDVSLVPLGSNRILVLKNPTALTSLPAFTSGSSIGPARTDEVWSSTPAALLNAGNSMGLPLFTSGVLAPVWRLAPGTLHVGIAIGPVESPKYGWISFDRDRGVRAPMAWGCSRVPGAPVTAGDPATIPSMTLKVAPNSNPTMLDIRWEPDFANMAIEESIGGGPWKLVGSTTPGGLTVSRAPDAGVLHLFRARRGP